MFLNAIFNLFNKNKQSIEESTNTIERKPWNVVIKECYDKGLDFIYPIIKVIYSDDKAQRAVIMQKPDMLYTTTFQKLYPYNDDELRYLSVDLQGFWSTSEDNICGIFDKKENAENEIFSIPPFKYNRCIAWKDFTFSIDAEKLYWISGDDPDDFCLHGQVFVKIGEEIFEYDPTVSATGLYLLRTLTENHIINAGEHMLPCCGNWMIASEDLSSVDIGGCPNGIDWSVIHEGGKIKLVTEAGNVTYIEPDDYANEVYAFADKIEAFYKNCCEKNIAQTDEMSKNGYIAFWNEWHRRKIAN